LSAAVYIVLEGEIPGLDPGVNGKEICLQLERLDRISADYDSPGLMDFLAESPEETRAALQKKGVLSHQLDKINSVWFSSEEGLKLVRLLLASLPEEPSFPKKANLIEDLQDFERVLAAASEAKVRWYLAIDY
jgi:hypothetical protein